MGAGEVQSIHSGSEGDADMMVESPLPAPAVEPRGGGLPDVRELVEALEQPLEVVGLQVCGFGGACHKRSAACNRTTRALHTVSFGRRMLLVTACRC